IPRVLTLPTPIYLRIYLYYLIGRPRILIPIRCKVMLLQYYTRPVFFLFYSRDPLGLSHLSSTNFNNIIAPYFFISSQIGTAHNGRNTFIISRLILVAMTVQNGLRINFFELFNY